ncbi:hypothetical protein R1flu_011248 [Riccia fluitans]|uniref:Uncharacterized protein n=1 Tax=Riccia fluitans TaxID=41844 RepID=A0ABD1Z7A1_9MARC
MMARDLPMVANGSPVVTNRSLVGANGLPAMEKGSPMGAKVSPLGAKASLVKANFRMESLTRHVLGRSGQTIKSYASLPSRLPLNFANASEVFTNVGEAFTTASEAIATVCKVLPTEANFRLESLTRHVFRRSSLTVAQNATCLVSLKSSWKMLFNDTKNTPSPFIDQKLCKFPARLPLTSLVLSK